MEMHVMAVKAAAAVRPHGDVDAELRPRGGRGGRVTGGTHEAWRVLWALHVVFFGLQ